MIRVLLALLLLVLAAAPALAQKAGTQQGPIKVTGDTFVIDEGKGVATFSGNVEVERTGLTVWAQKVVIEYGAGGPEDVKTFVATGKVRLKTKDQDATGDKATFDPNTQMLHMTGNVVVVNATGTLTGPSLTVNLADNSTVFEGGKGGRVTGVFSTQ
ncbi:MAG TPA: LptA/OstA family protein [Devosia sp.]